MAWCSPFLVPKRRGDYRAGPGTRKGAAEAPFLRAVACPRPSVDDEPVDVLVEPAVVRARVLTRLRVQAVEDVEPVHAVHRVARVGAGNGVALVGPVHQ